MRCYACGNELTGRDYCTACGADVAMYKKIRYLSNRLYNEGLDKARVRDLSGAILSLKQSLRLYKGNIDARNLLGLIYYETGEVVAALTQWVISKNFREEKNLAGDLLGTVQRDPQRLETLGRTAKKYNLALNYARQESYDLAIIQLKRILQLNPGFLRARELLALLHLRAGDFERARLECNRCLRIDSGSTLAKRYLKEAQSALLPTERDRGRRRMGSDAVRYQSGNEMIIQPARTGFSGGAVSLGTALLGIGLGIAIAWFLILPTRVTRVQEAAKQEITAVNEESDAKTAQMRNLEQQILTMEEQIRTMEGERDASSGEEGSLSVEALMNAAAAYLKDPEDLDTVRKYMADVDKNAPELENNEGASTLYGDLQSLVGKDLAEMFAKEGADAYRDGDDEKAIPALMRASELDPEDGESLFLLAQAYYRSGRTEDARTAFNRVVSDFPDSGHREEAQNLLAEINNAGT
ncbi:MAG: tetratricopeptide repeat protein [Lachnospiraceae bacterium]|nr:tetratricopeptide repeat protein [Lachnospiraceae bacterium]